MCSIHSIEIMFPEDSSLSLSKPLISNNQSRRRVLDGVRALHGIYTTGSAETVCFGIHRGLIDYLWRIVWRLRYLYTHAKTLNHVAICWVLRWCVVHQIPTVWSTDFAPYSASDLLLDKPARLPKTSMFRAELFLHENHWWALSSVVWALDCLEKRARSNWVFDLAGVNYRIHSSCFRFISHLKGELLEFQPSRLTSLNQPPPQEHIRR